MLLTYLYYMGALHQQWMLFWQLFLMVNKQFVNNTSGSGMKLITWLFEQLAQNQAKALLPNLFGRGCMCWIGEIYCSHIIEGANGSP